MQVAVARAITGHARTSIGILITTPKINVTTSTHCTKEFNWISANK